MLPPDKQTILKCRTCTRYLYLYSWCSRLPFLLQLKCDFGYSSTQVFWLSWAIKSTFPLTHLKGGSGFQASLCRRLQRHEKWCVGSKPLHVWCSFPFEVKQRKKPRPLPSTCAPSTPSIHLAGVPQGAIDRLETYLTSPLRQRNPP